MSASCVRRVAAVTDIAIDMAAQTVTVTCTEAITGEELLAVIQKTGKTTEYVGPVQA